MIILFLLSFSVYATRPNATHFYRFDDNGSNRIDSGLNPMPLESPGTENDPIKVAGLILNASKFDGVGAAGGDMFRNLTGTETLYDNFSLSLFIKPRFNADSSDVRLWGVEQIRSASLASAWVFFLDNVDTDTTIARFQMNNVTSFKQLTFSNFKMNEWSHVAMVYNNNGNFTAYVNNTKVATTKADNIIARRSHFQIGLRAQLGDQPFNGTMDHVKIWFNYTLTEADIEELFNEGFPAAPTCIITTNTTLSDQNLDCTATNFSISNNAILRLNNVNVTTDVRFIESGSQVIMNSNSQIIYT